MRAAEHVLALSARAAALPSTLPAPAAEGARCCGTPALWRLEVRGGCGDPSARQRRRNASTHACQVVPHVQGDEHAKRTWLARAKLPKAPVPFVHEPNTETGSSARWLERWLSPGGAVFERAAVRSTHVPFWTFRVKANVAYSAETSRQGDADGDDETAWATMHSWVPAPPESSDEAPGARHFGPDDAVCQVYAGYRLRADAAAAAKDAALDWTARADETG